jgi:hypothetical protein
MRQAPADREPSALPVGGYWLGMLFAGLPALVASYIVYSVVLPLRSESGPAYGILAIATASLPLIGVVAYYRSARRWGYSASPALAVVVVLLIWAGTYVALVLNSFGEMAYESLGPEPMVTARGIAESLLGTSVCLLTVNVACAPALNAEDWPGSAARALFLLTASLWGLLILIPSLIGILGAR